MCANKKNIFVIGLVLIFISNCQSNDQKEDTYALYKDCMKTFSDEKKCDELVNSRVKETSSNSNISVPWKKKEPAKMISPEDDPYKDLKIRSQVKDELQSKSRPYVENYLGEPDEVVRIPSGDIYYIYRRPVTRYAPGYPPDTELKVIFRRDQVTRINHISPND